ncbi:hypothetical protein LZ30DRAFT_693236 [Colletotrichum cereale]|nr:hypothetical protein LZ30DRAFT_693236 [Colletotrichum cereale]
MKNFKSEPIAIVGSSCRFPGGASSPSKLWDLLREPDDIAREIPASRFNHEGFYHQDGEHHGSTNVKHAYLLEEDHRVFDHNFFGISPKEAEAMDPQQRILLETVYEGIESAGYSMRRLRGSSTAVFVGMMNSDYTHLLLSDPDNMPHYTASGIALSIMANRISYFFDWKGPSLTIDTACSSSMVALHQAVQALRSSEADMAVVAGTNLVLGPEMFIAESKLHMLSPSGGSRMWDASVDGYTRGEGLASVVLKRLSQAIADNDSIECIIRETGVNQDGRTPGLTVPSAKAQAALIKATYAKCGLDLTRLEDRPQYFEAHGTGTPAGDPIEAEAIQRVFFPRDDAHPADDDEAEDDDKRLLVGSIKTVIGHLEGTAGLAGVLKASLALQHGFVPRNLHFDQLNPKIKPFYGHLRVPTATVPWPALPSGVSRRVSVNSFGFGGTNGHAILESWPRSVKVSSSSPSGVASSLPPRPLLDSHDKPDVEEQGPSPVPSMSGPFVLSANSGRALASAVTALSDHLLAHPDINLADLVYTLSRRSEFPFRASFSATDTAQLARKLAESKDIVASRPRAPAVPEMLPPRVLGIFTGQGAQWPGMGRELLSASAVFRGSIDDMQRSLDDLPDGPDWNLAEELSAPPETSRVDQAAVSQPLCTALQVALVDVLREAGVFFSAVVGHSSGEIGAAYAAGHLNARDAIRIAYYRGVHARLARVDLEGKGQQRGKMMAVGLSLEVATAFCKDFHVGAGAGTGRIAVAASNSQLSCTLAGDADAIDKAKEHLDEQGTFARLLKVDTAYHSHHMHHCAGPYLESMRSCNITAGEDGSTSNCAWYSSVHGSDGRSRSLTHDSVLAGQYWVENMTKPVLFSQALHRAITEEHCHDLVLEIGPHPSLKGPSSETIKALTARTLPYSGLLSRGKNGLETFADALGFVWEGFLCPRPQIDFEGIRRAFLGDGTSSSPPPPPPRLLQDLPTYCWDHERVLWKESRKSKAFRSRHEPVHDLLGHHVTSLGERDRREMMQWRQVFKLNEMSWARGHVFQGEVLFPATGYVAMAYEAAVRLVAAEEQPLGLVELHRLDFLRAMILAENSPGTDVTFHIRVTSRSPTCIKAEFSCYSGPVDADDGEVQTDDRLNFTGCANLFLDVARHDALPARVEPRLPMDRLDLDRLYKTYSQHGLEYSGDFLPETVSRRLNAAAVTTRPPKELTSLRVVHPGSLDAVFHSILAAFSYPGDGRLWAPYLPTHIDCIRINTAGSLDKLCTPDAPSPPPPQGPKIADCTVTAGDAKTIVGDVDVFCALEGHGEIQIRGAVLTCFAATSDHGQEDGPRQLYARHKWARDVAYGIEPSRRVVISKERRALGTLLDRSAYFYLRQIRDIRSEDELQSLTWNHRHLVTWVMEHLIPQVDAGNHPSLRPEWADDTEDMLDEWQSTNPGQIDLQIIRAVGENLLEILRGTVPALQVMMQDGMLDRLYTEGLGCREANQDLAALAGQLGHRYPHMKVLEIGAGTGGATHGVLGALQGRFASYTYTDISPGFFERARDIFGPYRGSSRMTFKTLNIENDPVAQGFEDACFDLIIASNVLHATQRLQDTMQYCRQLLRPGGHLLLLEITSDYTPAQLTMGTLPGWFLGIDDGRVWKPTIGVEQWDDVLKRTGFSGVDTIETSLFSVIISQAVNDAVTMMREPLSRTSTANTPLAAVDEVLILGVGTMVSGTMDLLCPRFSRVINVSGLDDMAANAIKASPSTAVLLVDLDAPSFRGMGEERFGALQDIVRNSGVILWVTQGAVDGSEPFASMAVGWGRSIRAESPGTKLQFLDLASSETTDPAMLATMLLRLVVVQDSPDDTQALWTSSYEPEIAVAADGAFYIPRVIADEVLNHRLHSAKGFISQKVSVDDAGPAIEVVSHDSALGLIQHSGFNVSDEEKRAPLLVLVSSALTLMTSDGQPTVLCIARDPRSGDKVLALSDTNASTIQVPETSIVRRLGDHEDDCKQLGQLLEVLLAESILAGVQGRVWVHGAEDHFAQTIETVAARQCDLDLFFTTSDTAGANESMRFIHPYITRRHLQQLVNMVEVQAFVNLEQPANEALSDLILGSLPSSAKACSAYSIRDDGELPLWCSRAALHGFIEQHLDAAQSTPPGTPRSNASHAQTIRINHVPGVAHSSLSPAAVIDWRKAETVEIKIHPLDHASLFSASKTYLLVGLTGDLGQSVCTWMVENGARHIVVCSRSPRLSEDVVDHLSQKGTTLRIAALDISDRDALQAVYQDIKSTMPPVGGVMNAAMVLRDRLFVNATWADFAAVLAPKVQGSQYLDELFRDDSSLDFFVLFSSLTCVMGNAGQSAYSAANSFMTGLVEQRRRSGLPASVVHIAMMVGLGYVHRASDDIEAGLRNKLMTLAETDLHDLLAEAIVGGRPRPPHESGHGEIITGLKRGAASFWAENPRLWHYLIGRDKQSVSANGGRSAGTAEGSQGRRQAESIGNLLAAAENEEAALTVLENCFTTMLGNILQLEPSQIDKSRHVVDLGIDSLVAVQVRSWFLKEVGVEVPVLRVLGDNSSTQLCRDVLAQRRQQQKDGEQKQQATNEEEATKMVMDWDSELATLCAEVLKLVPAGDLPSEQPLDGGCIDGCHDSALHGLRVVVTGATGFLGSWMLRKLVADSRVEEVHCIAIRANSQALASRVGVRHVKIHEYAGDLATPMLGLSTTDFVKLARVADVILHLGVDGNITKTYSELRAANVGSTQQLLGMAAPRHVPLHYVSASAVAALQGVDGGIAELGEVSAAGRRPSQNIQRIDFAGLTATKWVCEVLLERAEVDVPVMVHRCVHLVGKGARDTSFLAAVDRYSRELRAVPELEKCLGNHVVQLADVAQVAEEMVAAALEPALEAVPRVIVRNHCGGYAFRPRNMAETYRDETGHPMQVGTGLLAPMVHPCSSTYLSRESKQPRRDVEALVAQGRKLFILDDFVIKADAWIPYHPGGNKSILHMVGRDATDEVTALHSIEAKQRMNSYRIGTIQGRWDNFIPPIQGGTFRARSDGGQDEYHDADTASSPASPHRSNIPSSESSDDGGPARRKSRTAANASISSSISSISSTHADEAMAHLDFVTKQKISLDLETYPSLDHPTQDVIVAAYRRLDDRLRAQGLYDCNYRVYAVEIYRYSMLFAAMLLFLHWGWYVASAVCMGAFWHQMSFAAHDAGHIGITHRFHIDSVLGIFIADFMGGLSLGWWKKSHNIHHIVTNSPEHDPDVEYLPFLAVSHRFLAGLRSTYYDRMMDYDAVARFCVKFQKYSYYPLLALGRFNLYRLSWEYLLTGQAPRKGPAWWHRHLEIAGQVFFWSWYGYGIVYKSIPNNMDRFIFVMVSHVTVLPLHVQITLSHFAMSTVDLGPQESFPQKMLRTTMDVDCPRWLDFFHGGLQFQVIHHLFPRIPRHNLRRAQELVQEFCNDVGIPYALYGFVEGNEKVIGALGEVSRQAAIFAKCQREVASRGGNLSAHGH